MASKRAVFLDRDGVVNEAFVREGKPCPPRSVAETVIVPDAEDALGRLRQHGFALLVVTNQPGVRRGTSTEGAVKSIHEFLRSRLPIDDFFVCYHDDSDECSCRKPRPGLITQAAAAYDIDVGDSFMVGDRWRDIEAGAAAGCRTVFIDRGYNERVPRCAADVSVFSLSEAVNWILKKASSS